MKVYKRRKIRKRKSNYQLCRRHFVADILSAVQLSIRRSWHRNSSDSPHRCSRVLVFTLCYVLFYSRPQSEGWPHHGRTFSIYPCPLSFWLTLPRGVLSTFWCCPSKPCVVFLACVHLTLFLALSLSPGNKKSKRHLKYLKKRQR